MKKLLALTLCAVMTASLLTGCGGKDNKKGGELPEAKTEAVAGEPGWKADTDPTTLDWYVNYSWYTGMWETGEFSQYIESKTGVKANLLVPSEMKQRK